MSFYIVIRMWSPPEESSSPEKAKYVQQLADLEGGAASWTLTEDWKEAHYFTAARVAGRVVVGVDRLRTRIARGWVYEIVKVTEEVLSSNIVEEEVPETEEVA